jgi:DNA repair protein RadC
VQKLEHIAPAPAPAPAPIPPDDFERHLPMHSDEARRRRRARENPATDLQDAIPWVRVTRDPERYKEAIARAQKIGPIDDAKKVYDLVGSALMKEDQETFIVVLIDVRQNCRGVAEIHRGTRSRVSTSTLDVMRVVVASGAEGFIVCHNHPSGNATPSDADRSLTKAIARAAKPFAGETAFLDHVVVGSGQYYSFTENKLRRVKN